MSLLSFLGLDDLADGVREFTDSIDELKQDIVSSIVEPSEEFKSTVQDIATSVTEGNTPEAVAEATTE